MSLRGQGLSRFMIMAAKSARYARKKVSNMSLSWGKTERLIFPQFNAFKK